MGGFLRLVCPAARNQRTIRARKYSRAPVKVIQAPGGGKHFSLVKVVALRPVFAGVGLEGMKGFTAQIHHAVLHLQRSTNQQQR